jgi:predicted AAA+ superfamily ATPase
LTGFLFESQVVHDLRVYGLPHRATVRFYRDNKGLEVDAVLETHDGLWIAFEVKLGASRVDEGASNLLAMHGKLASDAQERCRGLVVVVSDSPTYRRPDGVIVTSIAALGP